MCSWQLGKLKNPALNYPITSLPQPRMCKAGGFSLQILMFLIPDS
jgi:hypothetical protein